MPPALIVVVAPPVAALVRMDPLRSNVMRPLVPGNVAPAVAGRASAHSAATAGTMRRRRTRGGMGRAWAIAAHARRPSRTGSIGRGDEPPSARRMMRDHANRPEGPAQPPRRDRLREPVAG